MRESRKRAILRQDYEQLRQEAVAAIIRLGVEPWNAWEAVKAAERSRESCIPMAMHFEPDDHRRQK